MPTMQLTAEQEQPAVCPFGFSQARSLPAAANDQQQAELIANKMHPITQLPVVASADLQLPANLAEFSWAQIGRHTSAECGWWLVVDGLVNDVTILIIDDIHPGGVAILKKYAGRVASKMFHSVHADASKIIAHNFLRGKVAQQQ